MKRKDAWLIIVPLVLAGCSQAVSAGGAPPAPTRTPPPSATPSAKSESPEAASATGETRTDDQGSVVFSVTPLNLASPGETLEFEVVMNTHSVDLGWDLAARSILQTDTGVEVGATGWPIGGGHHYGATLSFPAITADGEPILEGSTQLTLIIRDTDVPERRFTWELTP